MQQLRASLLGKEFARWGNIILSACKEKRKNESLAGGWMETWDNLTFWKLEGTVLESAGAQDGSYVAFWSLHQERGYIINIKLAFFCLRKWITCWNLILHITHFPEIVINIICGIMWLRFLFITNTWNNNFNILCMAKTITFYSKCHKLGGNIISLLIWVDLCLQ